MKQQLSRVQVYLDPTDVAVVDRISRAVKVKRSQVIRDAVKAVAKRYADMAVMVETKKRATNSLMELAGIGESKTGTVGLNIDEMYLHD